MIIGSKSFFDQFQETRSKTRPDQAKRVADNAVWVTPEWYVLPESGDGRFEGRVEQELEELGQPNLLWVPYATGTADPVDFSKQSFKPVDRRPPETTSRDVADSRFQDLKSGRSPDNMPKAAKPPSAFQKVRSYWHAVSGPKVEQSTFDHRLTQCTSIGGYTFSPFAVQVMRVPHPRRIEVRFGERKGVYLLPKDETAAVRVDESVQAGQVIAKGDADKPCPWMVAANGKRHCTACGCGYRKAADLDKKLWHANLQCPRIPPLFTPVTIENSS